MTLDMTPAVKNKQSAVEQHHNLCLSPAEIYEHVAGGGQAKQRNSWLKEVVLGIMAGGFIGFGFATCMIAAGQVSEEELWKVGAAACMGH